MVSLQKGLHVACCNVLGRAPRGAVPKRYMLRTCQNRHCRSEGATSGGALVRRWGMAESIAPRRRSSPNDASEEREKGISLPHALRSERL